MRVARFALPAVVAALLLVAAGEARALDLGKAGDLIQRALGRKSAEPAPGQAGAPGAFPEGAAFESPGAVADREAAADTALIPPAPLDDILLSPEPYLYQGIGRRDPFVSLVGDDYREEHEEEFYQLSDFVVRGILWGERDRFVLMERADGSSFILREGERLGPYTVSRIEPDAVLMYISEFGVGRTERLGLAEWKGNPNARNHR